MILGGRYKVLSLEGEGTFGRVLRCQDIKRDSREICAVKVIKGVKRYCDHAEIEADILEAIMERDEDERSRCVRLRRTFFHHADGGGGSPQTRADEHKEQKEHENNDKSSRLTREHFCMVFEPLGLSLHELLQINDEEGLFLRDVQTIARQLCESLAFLHSMELSHTDLKCRNVMLRSKDTTCARIL